MREALRKSANPNQGFDEIFLTRKERRLLKRIMRRGEVPGSFCSDEQIAFFEKCGFIIVNRDEPHDFGYGISGICQGVPKQIAITDKATRYFLFRKEDYFKGKLPVVIAIIALVVSIAAFLLSLAQYVNL